MLIVETIAKIRRYHFVEGKTIKQIVRELRISRNTVRKVLRSGATEHHYERDKQPVPKLGAYTERLDKLLEEEATLPRNRRLTAQRVHELFQEEGYQGAYDTRLCKKAEVGHFSLHQLRHLAASILKKQGASLAEMQLFLRHDEQKTTKLYAGHLDNSTEAQSKCLGDFWREQLSADEV